MSCCIVDIEHIRVLVQAGLDQMGVLAWPADQHSENIPGSPENGIHPGWHGLIYRQLTDASAGAVGQMLVDANARGVNDRYNEDELYIYDHARSTRRSRNAVELLKAIRGLIYQCREADDWETSEAKNYLDVLTARLINDLPGYDEAEWLIAS